jgi:alpha-tubulin suppressor-like RCC1 family protein
MWQEQCNIFNLILQNGQLGVGDLVNKNTFTLVLNITGVIKIFAGESHTLFLTNDTSLWSVGKGTVKKNLF